MLKNSWSFILDLAPFPWHSIYSFEIIQILSCQYILGKPFLNFLYIAKKKQRTD